MSSGQKRLLIQSRERAVSTDIARLQTFIAADQCIRLGHFYNDRRLNYITNPGVAAPVVSIAPVVADIYGGFMVSPDNATSLTISGGSMSLLFPDSGGTVDDSAVIFVNDPGVQTLGVLPFTANGGGGVRVDLVECQPVDTLLESDSRDIFVPATGLFAPATVEKVRAFRMTYRIRLGTPGGGLPALATGWLPLTVAIVPVGAADFGSCDFYDVRPLVEERVAPQPINGTRGRARVNDAEFQVISNSGAMTIQGFAETVFGGYRAGGWLRRSTAYGAGGTRTGAGNADGDPTFINLELAENQALGYTLTSSGLITVGAFFPGGLPRWVRYSESAIGGGFGRVPQGPRGILMLTDGQPGKNGIYSPQGLPAQIGIASAPGAALASIRLDAAGASPLGSTAVDGWTFVQYDGHLKNDNAGTRTTSFCEWFINPAIDIPRNARFARLTVVPVLTPGTGFILRLTVADSAGNVFYNHVMEENVPFTVDVPMLGMRVPDDPVLPLDLRIQATGINISASSQQLIVEGWKL